MKLLPEILELKEKLIIIKEIHFKKGNLSGKIYSLLIEEILEDLEKIIIDLKKY